MLRLVREDLETVSVPTTAAPPAVLAVLVAHEGVRWLPRTLDALLAQSHAPVEIVAVDNASTDGSRELLLERLGEDRVLIADRDLGFAGAVSMALDARAAADAPYVLLVHDDLELASDAVAELVATLEADPRLAIVGPKLKGWGATDELQAVGSTIDITGRVDAGVDVGELDQGQRDQERRTLYVSTAGMMIRRETMEQLGRLDRRFHVFRDDLDLCWRAWIAGHDVEVVPSAVANHAASAANYLRLGQTRFIGPRYFDERNTLASLIKNYSALKLLVVVPLYLLVGVAKVLGFLLTRRFSDAWQTVRAWVWNLTHLRESRRYRRRVQQQRVRSDAELSELFGRLGTRLRAYAEAMASWISGGDADPVPEPAHDEAPPPEPETVTRRVVALTRRRPVLFTGVALTLLAAVGSWPLLLPGQLRGGQLAPWPSSPMALLSDYVAGWHEAAAFGTAATPSPAQALLGGFHLVLGGNTYLASRGVLLLPLAVGWLLALRAAQTYSDRRPPRVVAATAYVLSPPALAALVTGRLDALVVLAALPGLFAGYVTLTRRTTPPARAWRAVAAVVLFGAVAGAFEPAVLLVLLAVGALVAVASILRARELIWRLSLAGRLAIASVGPLLLLFPWSLELFAANGPLLARPAATPEVAGDELWAWLLLSPSLAGFPGLVAGVGFLLAGLLGLALGWRRSAGLVSLLWIAALLGATAAWWADRADVGIWAGTPLLVTAAAFAGTFALAFATGARQLARHAFGWRQIAAGITALAVTVSIASVAWTWVRAPFDAFVVDEPTLPSFVIAEAESEGPFRVVVLAATEGEVAWEVVDGRGVTMAAYGLRQPAAVGDEVRAAIADLLERRDPSAADRLGRLGIRYLIVPEGAGAPELSAALLRQTSLEPRPVATGELHAVTGWLPMAAVLTAAEVAVLDERGAPPADAELDELEPLGGGRYVGEVTAPGAVLLAEAIDDRWRLEVDGTAFAPSGDTAVRFDEVPAGTAEITFDDTLRPWAVAVQVLLLLLVISLALRPPGIARRQQAGATVEGGRA
ncbi:MAG: glycosyltransferase [Actinomycetota bacterium]